MASAVTFSSREFNEHVLTTFICRFSIGWKSRETMMIGPVLVRPLPNYRIYLEFSDGVKGEVDLSYLVGKGVFQAWNDYNFSSRFISVPIVRLGGMMKSSFVLIRSI